MDSAAASEDGAAGDSAVSVVAGASSVGSGAMMGVARCFLASATRFCEASMIDFDERTVGIESDRRCDLLSERYLASS